QGDAFTIKATANSVNNIALATGNDAIDAQSYYAGQININANRDKFVTNATAQGASGSQASGRGVYAYAALGSAATINLSNNDFTLHALVNGDPGLVTFINAFGLGTITVNDNGNNHFF